MMQNFEDAALAGWVKFGAGAGVFFVWTVFEKQIIEPFRIDRYMPFYRIEGICAWDIAAITAIFLIFRSLSVRSRSRVG